MVLIGSHVSFKSDSQLLGSANEAISYGSNCFMFYTGAPQNTKRSKLSYDLTLKARDVLSDNNINLKNVVIHAPYIINLANNSKMESYLFGISFLKEEINRANMLGVEKLVLHPGSSVKLSKEEGIKNIINALNEVITPLQTVKICIETMAGKGSEVGSNLEEIKEILDNVKYKDKVMVCLDTCHLNDAGYDMKDFDKFLDYFDKLIGIDKIGVIHVNDSKNGISSHKDRHENLGYGTIGFDNLINIIYNKRVFDVPKILETPYVTLTDDDKKKAFAPYKFEIESIKDKTFNDNLYEDVRSYYNKK